MRLMILGMVLACAGAAQAGPVPGAVEAVNAYRFAAGVPPVTLSETLQATATAHGRDMVQKDYFSHKGQNGSRPKTRARNYGYRSCTIGENIARGQGSLQQVMTDWANSPSHRKVLHMRKARDMGLARVSRNGGDVWVLVMGAENC